MKSVWMFIIGMMSLLPLSGVSEVRIEDVRATSVAPWGRIVVDYTVAGTLPADATNYVAAVTASNRTTGTVYTGELVDGELELSLGKHRIWWNACAAGLQEAVEAVDVSVSYVKRPVYCVIDLSGGSDAAAYPVSYLWSIQSDGWVDEYKTTKLVLRRIPAGSFIMGSDQTTESHRVTLTKPFYMGVFEVTQRQWELVMGTNPSYYSKKPQNPVEHVSYDDIRGSSSGAQWPASAAVDTTSFLGKLRARTGLDFDLPTEAQWENACRAGTMTTYYWGDSMDYAYAWCWRYNSDMKTYSVGTKLPNAWGLYDMSGNVWEWCRDWFGTLAYGTDPVGSASGSYRVGRGGSWHNSSGYCTSSRRSSDDPSYRNFNYGFRLVRVLSD